MQEKQKKDAEAAASGKAVKQSAGELRLQKGTHTTPFLILICTHTTPSPHRSLTLPPNFTTHTLSPADISELDLPKGVSIRFPEGNDKIMNFEIILKPDEGIYRGGAFLFSFSVPIAYPHEPPKVKCLTKVYHPNIDLEGNVCLNILREDWKPVLTVTSIVYGLNFLFLVRLLVFFVLLVYQYNTLQCHTSCTVQAPNPEDPLNKEAAYAMQTNSNQFERNVVASITRGGTIGSDYFPAARGERTL